MEIRNIGLLVDPFSIDKDVVALASDLARRNHGVLTGVAAASPPIVLTGMDGGVAGAVYADQYAELETSLKAAGETFAGLVPQGVRHRWEWSVQRPDNAILAIARAIDIIVVGAEQAQAGPGELDMGSVLLGSGRPVLLPAQGLRKLKAARIVIAWKDTREARRATADALPLLKQADDVVVIVVDEGNLAAERPSMLDVVGWLASHEVKARGDVLPDRGGVARTITQASVDYHTDLVVSGAYGHSRLREWLFGGATRDLLAEAGISRLMSA